MPRKGVRYDGAGGKEYAERLFQLDFLEKRHSGDFERAVVVEIENRRVFYPYRILLYTVFLGYSYKSNKAVLEDLEIRHTQRTIELTGFNKMGTIEKILREQGSNLRMPEKPATLIED